MFEQLKQQLEQVGLSRYEAMIFAVLTETSPAGASYVARKCKLSRSSVYTALDSLVSKGLVGVSYKNEVKQFVAQDFTAVENVVRAEKARVVKKAEALGDVRNSMELMVKGAINVPKVMVFEGQEGLRKIYMSMMMQARANSTLYLLRDEFVWADDWKFIFEEEWHERVKRIKIEKNITTKLLINQSKEEKAHIPRYKQTRGLEFRFLGEKDSVKEFALYVLDDTVSTLSMEQGNLVGVRTVNLHLARNHVKIFQALWDKAGG
jgi:sugar-specific transcriptional regulator TrmB